MLFKRKNPVQIWWGHHLQNKFGYFFSLGLLRVKNHTLNPIFGTTSYLCFNCLNFRFVGLALIFNKKLSFLEVTDHLKLKHFGNAFALIILFKVRLSPSKKVDFSCFNKSPLKTMNNAFYFIVKALFVLNPLTTSVPHDIENQLTGFYMIRSNGC